MPLGQLNFAGAFGHCGASLVQYVKLWTRFQEKKYRMSIEFEGAYYYIEQFFWFSYILLL